MIRGAGIILVATNTGHILLQHRSPDEEAGQETWGNFGGKIHDYETFVEGAVREFCEETGFYPSIIDKSKLIPFVQTANEYVHYVTYVYLVDQEYRFANLDINESTGYGWFDVHLEVPKLDLFPPFAKALHSRPTWKQDIQVFVDYEDEG